MTTITNNIPQVGIIMGSSSDWEVMKSTADILNDFSIPYEARVISAHRAPKTLMQYAESAEVRGLKIIIAGAGMAAHLPGVTAAFTHLPVIGVPIDSSTLGGQDALYAIVQMPPGIPVMTMAIGKPGAKNAALSAIAMLSLNDLELREKLLKFRKNQTDKVIQTQLV